DVVLGRETGENQRIVTRDDMVERTTGEIEHSLLRAAMGRLIDEDGKGDTTHNVGVEMSRIAGEHHRPALRLAAYCHQPGSMTRAQAQRDTGRELGVAIVEHDMIGIELAHELRDRLAIEGRANL